MGLSDIDTLAAAAAAPSYAAAVGEEMIAGRVDGSHGGGWMMQAALSDEQFKQRQHTLRQQLAELQCQQLHGFS